MKSKIKTKNYVDLKLSFKEAQLLKGIGLCGKTVSEALNKHNFIEPEVENLLTKIYNSINVVID